MTVYQLKIPTYNAIVWFVDAFITNIQIYKDTVESTYITVHCNMMLQTVQWQMYRADSRFVPSQWETSLQSNAVSHWLGANLESALNVKYEEVMTLSISLHYLSVTCLFWMILAKSERYIMREYIIYMMVRYGVSFVSWKSDLSVAVFAKISYKARLYHKRIQLHKVQKW